MSEEVKIKKSRPMFEVGELERFDNNMQNIVEEYSKLMLKEKDQILTQRIIMKQEEEIKKLHSIIKEIRKYIEKHRHKSSETLIQTCENFIKEQEYLLSILDMV